MNSNILSNLREIFNRHDPIGIYFGKEINWDEYDPEISELLVRWRRSKNLKEFTSEIHNVFVKMFDRGIAGPKSKYEKLSKEVYNFLNNKLKDKTKK